MLALRNIYRSIFSLFLLISASSCIYSNNYPQPHDEVFSKQYCKGDPSISKSKKSKNLVYYLYISDFIKSFIEIPTSNVLSDSSTASSTYLAGRAPLYEKKDKEVGTCSASFLCIQNTENIYTDISNYLSVNNGLIVTWFTPTTLLNLELDSIVHSMVTECIVVASTKVGFNPFYGTTFNMIVSSDNSKIYFKLSKYKG